ncbi:MAG: transglycosylase SLT domain-containing protein [Bdellovibrionales bacterium]|nr:transglycosylase SLT domain-containing protein [Bdellovibrionales bacterium]
MKPKKTTLVACIALSVLITTSCATPVKRSNSTTNSNGKTIAHDAPLLPGMKANPPEKADEPRPTPSPLEITEIPQDLETDESALKEEILASDESVAPDQGNVATDDSTDDLDNEDQPQIKAAPKKQIPFEFNQKVASWIQYFSQNDRERFQRFLDRGEPYREVVENILEENKVPTDLYYLGLIESGFVTNAKSHAKAVGVWQFMPSTGKLYGLARDGYVDERRDPVRATEAAAKMLRDLHEQFGSWYLAMAAYNAGPGRIKGAIRRGGTNDFWELVEKKKLPRETMEYVPKFIAARYIGENPDLFAFYINEEKRYPNVELVKVPSPVSFEKIEKAAGIPGGTLSFVNPHYLHSYTHPGKREDEIWVPENYVKNVEAKASELGKARLSIKPTRATRAAREKILVYRVKRGDTLKSIARKQKLSVAYLKQVNGLRSAKIMPGQKLKLSASSYRQKRAHPRKKGTKRKR